MIDKDYYNYFMLPQYVEGIGEIYPIKIFEYDAFKKYASKYLLAGRKWLTNICKYPKNEYIFDFFVKNALVIETLKMGVFEGAEKSVIEEVEKNEIIRYNINEIEEMLSLTLRKKVEFELLDIIDNNTIDYRFKIEDTNNYITKFNFEQYREIVMEQNLLFEPLTSPSDKGNEVIQNAINALSKQGVEQSLIAVCSTVSVQKGISDDELKEYTYYRLMCDFETVNRVNNNLINAIFMAQGSDAKIVYLGEKIDVNKDPYKNLLRRSGDNQLDKRLQSR